MEFKCKTKNVTFADRENTRVQKSVTIDNVSRTENPGPPERPKKAEGSGSRVSGTRARDARPRRSMNVCV